MVIVDVEDPDPLAGRGSDGVGDDRRVVEEAVAAVHRPSGVVAGRPAQAVCRGLAAEDEIHRGQRDIDRRAGRVIGPGDERRRGVEAPEPGPSADVLRLPDESLDRAGRHALEHRDVRIRVGRQEGARDRLGPDLGPGHLEEPDEALVVDGRDRRFPMNGRVDEREPTVGLEGGSDPLCSLGDLVGGDRRRP